VTSLRPSTAFAVTLCLVLAPAASATTEDGDAGDLPHTAQDLSAAVADRIDGTLADGSDIDVYRLCLSGGGTFSATTVGGTAVDTQLFLLDSGGVGVYANDDSDGTSQSRLPAGDPLTPQAAGTYHLAITPYNRDPESALGAIFADLTGVLGPIGAGGLLPLASWSGRPGDSGAYSISLTGAGCLVPDATPPTIDLRAPADGATFVLGRPVEVDYSCADEDGGSGLASCTGTPADGALLDTSRVGPVSATVTAVDNAGNQAAVTHTAAVVYDFGGFLWPVRKPPRVTRWRAGKPVPIRFSLGGDRGLRVIEEGWPRVARVDCGSGTAAAGGDPARVSKLHYHAGRYWLLWKTDRRWKGCRQLLLKLRDGTVKHAEFRFTRRRH
jgi:hypothetical protein